MLSTKLEYPPVMLSDIAILKAHGDEIKRRRFRPKKEAARINIERPRSLVSTGSVYCWSPYKGWLQAG
jgi:hypothetical protein